MSRFWFSAFALAISGLLAACVPPVAWQKPGVTLAEAQADSRDCASLARDQAFRESFFAGPYFGGFGPMPYRYSPYGYHRHDSFMWRSQREGDLQNFCLRARGYHLAPVPQ
ncbi:MAG: hypothetical protein VW600_04755 [Ferrovibrio sp.]